MGAKTALLAFAEGDVPPALLGAMRCDPTEAEELVRRIHPGYDIAPAGEGNLGDDVRPPDDITYATALAGVDLYCDRRLVFDRPSELPKRLLELGAGRRIVMHGMDSVVDWLCFAVWEDGRLIRSLSLSPRRGVEEDIGEPYGFERPYWAGSHPVSPTPGWPNQRPYPLPFHPLDLGEQALRSLFGFVVEGRPGRDDVEPFDVHLHGFRVTDPSGNEQATRAALYAKAREAMGQPRRYRIGPDGALREIDVNSA